MPRATADLHLSVRRSDDNAPRVLRALEAFEVWRKRLVTPIHGMEVPIIGHVELLRNKRALGRTKDMADIEALEEPT